jgi:hypothetical protein
MLVVLVVSAITSSIENPSITVLGRRAELVDSIAVPPCTRMVPDGLATPVMKEEAHAVGADFA